MLEQAFDLCELIRARGRQAFVAGGAVRDLLLRLPVTEVDIATDMTIAELDALFVTHAVGRSRQFETVVVSRGGVAFEVTRLRGAARRDGEPPPRGEEALRADTAHRDFTVNALLMGPDRRVIDLQGGLADLGRRLIRAVGAPEERFAEDPARVLRAVRFAATLGFAIEPATARALTAWAPRLAGVAKERVGAEVLKMASRDGAALADGVELLERFGLLGAVLPELAGLQGLEQPPEHHPEGDVWRHTLAALRAPQAAGPAVNLAVLLHDVGKRPTHIVEEGRHRFPGHEGVGAQLAEAAARRLFLPQRVREALVFAVAQHGLARRIGELRRSKRLALVASEHWPVLRALALCDVGARGEPGALAEAEALLGAAEDEAAAERTARGGAPPVSGTRVMELTGLAPGPRVGEILRRVSAWALDGGVIDRELIEAQVLRERQQLEEEPRKK